MLLKRRIKLYCRHSLRSVIAVTWRVVTCSAAAHWRSADGSLRAECQHPSHHQGFVSSVSCPRCVPLSPDPWLCCRREGCPRLPEAAALRCCSRVCLDALEALAGSLPPRRCRWCPVSSTAHCQRNTHHTGQSESVRLWFMWITTRGKHHPSLPRSVTWRRSLALKQCWEGHFGNLLGYRLQVTLSKT